MLSETELDPYFEVIQQDAFRLEALPAYAVPVESAGMRAYLAGEPFQKSEAGQAFNEFVRGQVEAGATWRRVRVVRDPLATTNAGSVSGGTRSAKSSAITPLWLTWLRRPIRRPCRTMTGG